MKIGDYEKDKIKILLNNLLIYRHMKPNETI